MTGFPVSDPAYLLVMNAGPTVEPVTLSEVKAQCRVDFTDDDVLLSSYITAATAYLDVEYGILGQAIITQDWDLSVAGPDILNRIRLPISPVQDVQGIAYFDTDNAVQAATIANYQLLKHRMQSYLEPIEGEDWPSTFSRVDAITITLRVGFGLAAAVPQPIKQAIMLLVCHWYENREASVVGTSINTVPMAFDAMVAPYRRVFIP